MPPPPAWSLVTPPAAAQILPLATVKDHCRIDQTDTDHDNALTIYMAAAIASVEQRLGRVLLQQTWRASFEGLASDGSLTIIRGPNPVVQNVRALLSGAYSTLDPLSYVVRPLAGRDALKIARPMVSQFAWPVADRDPAAWTVDVQIGWPDLLSIPTPIISAMLLIVGDLFTNRDAKIQSNLIENSVVDALLSPYRAASI